MGVRPGVPDQRCPSRVAFSAISSNDRLAGAYDSDVLFGGFHADAFLVFPDDSRPDFNPAEDVLLDVPTALMHLFAR